MPECHLNSSYIYSHLLPVISTYYNLGLATRLCDGAPAMWQPPNVAECSTVEITRITEEVENLNAIFEATQNSSNSDRTVMVDPEVLESITGELASVTEKDENTTSFLPNDLEDTIDTLGTILRYIVDILA